MTAVSPDAVVEVCALRTRAGMHVVSAFWHHPSARLTLLYTRGNAVDLKQSRLWPSLPRYGRRASTRDKSGSAAAGQCAPLPTPDSTWRRSHFASSLLTASTMGCYFVGSPVTSPKQV